MPPAAIHDRRGVYARLAHLSRYAVAGAIVGVVYVSLTFLLDGPAGLPIQVAIPIAYALAICLHFLLQRGYVFASEDAFALTTGNQARRYVVIAGVQYAVTAAATALLPGILGLHERLVYLGCVAVISLTTFAVLRRGVFHAHGG